MKRHKINLRRSAAKLKLRRLPVKLVGMIIIVFFALNFTIKYLNRSLRSLDYFKIKEVLVNEGQSEEFRYLEGHNIFNLDLIKESQEIAKLYPLYKKIKLVRILPNRLFVEFVKRDPTAIIKLYRYFCVDKEMVLFDSPDDIHRQDLPIITGLETKLFGPQVGKEYNIPELTLALEIIKEFRRNRRLSDYKIKTVNVKKLSHTDFILSAGPEVKIGQDYIRKKIDLLSGLLIQLKNEQNNINYIDLRFKEPVIKFKDK